MARIKLAYIGGGSSRAAGTMASLLSHGKEFDGSEVVLVDLDAERLEIVRTIAEKMARNAGLDITVSATTVGTSQIESKIAIGFRKLDRERAIATVEPS